jgi:hypothetical protein
MRCRTPPVLSKQLAGRDDVNLDWPQLMWKARWDALAMIWNAIVNDVAAHWWFGPLLLVLVIAAGRKGMFRLAAYIARVFVHTH